MLNILAEGRIEGILNNVIYEDGFFPCHKTYDYDYETEGLQEQNMFCAGALAVIEKAGATSRNRNTRLAVGLKLYDPKELKDVEQVIDPSDFLKTK